MTDKFATAEQLEALLPAIQKLGKEGLYKKHGLLYIEPTTDASTQPVLDEITRKMTSAFRNVKLLPWGFGGVHQCICGATSAARDFVLPNGLITNSLCVHYIALHRDAVPAEEIEKILRFSGEAEPTVEEIQKIKK